MPSRQTALRVRTGQPHENIDITEQVRQVVRESGIRVGMALLAVRHTTVGIILNEDEPGLVNDLDGMLETVVPARRGYAHDRVDNNAHSHLRSILLGNSLTLPVIGGELDLGTWQRVLLVEQDGPRERTVRVVIVGDEG